MREPEVAEIEEDDIMEDEPKKKKKARAPTLRKTKNDANAPNPTRVPLLGLQEHLLTAGDKADWLSYYRDLEHRVKLTGMLSRFVLNLSNFRRPEIERSLLLCFKCRSRLSTSLHDYF